MAKDDYTGAVGERNKKVTRQVSGISVQREKPPTNPGVAERFTNFVFDHSLQLPVVPWSLVGRSGGIGAPRVYGKTTNKNGRAALPDSAFVGGSPDERGKPFAKPTKPKKTYY